MPKVFMGFSLDKEVADEIKKLRVGVRSYEVNEVLKKHFLRPKKRRRSS